MSAGALRGARTPWHLWVVGVLAALWNGFGCFDYVMTQTRRDEWFVQMGMTEAQLTYFNAMPAWTHAAWAIGVWGGLLGALLLLLHRKWATPVFVVSFALVSAAPEPRSGTIDAPLLRQEIGRESYMRVCAFDAPGAQGSQSRYRTLSASEDGALVELEPLTGRMHQLRVHMAHIGRPLVGDPRYGGALTFAGRAAPRLMLHAAKLTFPHPEGGDRTVEAPCPADFEALRQAAEL